MTARLGHIPADESPTLSEKSCQLFWPDGTFRYDAFGPRQHIQALHPENTRIHNGIRKGIVSFAQRVSDGPGGIEERVFGTRMNRHLAADSWTSPAPIVGVQCGVITRTGEEC